MDVISKDKRYIITMPEELYGGKDLQGKQVEVIINQTDKKSATIYTLAHAISECFDKYGYDYATWAPTIHVIAHITEKVYEFYIDWQMEDIDYVCLVADQFKL